MWDIRRPCSRAVLNLCLIALILFVHGVAMGAASGTDPVPATREGWRLTFEDDFDGDALDLTKWSYLPDGPRKDGYWLRDEVFLDGNGHLIIQTSERDGNYYSGAITTRGKFEQAYGYYEIRAQLPKEEGFWTAFWIMVDGVHRVGDEGRDGTEIDIFESPFANTDRIQHALHWDGYGEHHKNAGHAPHIPGIYEGFHTFALEWNEDEYIFYVDGEETWRTSAGGISEVPSWVQVTAEVGTWAGDIRNANLPAQLIVDYVRVYERIHDITFESPVSQSTVVANAPVRFTVDSDVTIAEVQVLQNDVELYRGDRVPDTLTLGAPVQDENEWHTLTVRVTDTAGQVSERSVRFRVRRAALVVPQAPKGNLQGMVELGTSYGFSGGERVERAELAMVPTHLFDVGEKIVVYEGASVPKSIALDTLAFADGAYDLQMTLWTDQGNIVSDVHRILVRNWNYLREPFEPPTVFFGIEIDAMHTVARSEGWRFASDDPDAFFGDAQRLVPTGERNEYLIWQLAHLRHYDITLYAKSEALQDVLEIAVSSDLEEWQALDYDVATTARSESGWLQINISGAVPAELDADHFRVQVFTDGLTENAVQLGFVELTGLFTE